MSNFQFSFGTPPQRGGSSPFGGLSCLLSLAVFAGFLYLTYKFLWYKWTAPAFLLLTLAINYRVVLSFGQTLVGVFRRDIFMGIVLTALCAFGFPVVALLLFIWALAGRRAEQFKQQFEAQFGKFQGPFEKEAAEVPGEYVEYEEIKREQLRLPEVEKEKNDPFLGDPNKKD